MLYILVTVTSTIRHRSLFLKKKNAKECEDVANRQSLFLGGGGGKKKLKGFRGREKKKKKRAKKEK